MSAVTEESEISEKETSQKENATESEYAICPSSMPNEAKYRSYPFRWYILLVTCLLALSNAAIWISFSAVQSHVNVFYCDKSYFGATPEDQVDSDNPAKNSEGLACKVAYWNGQIFQIIGCVLGICGIFVTDKYGILVSTYCASILNFVGILLRTISASPALNHSWRLSLLYIGQTIAASSQPFFLVLSPKVAEYWFSDTQRALANALSFAANPAGVVLGTVAPEIIISGSTKRNDSELFWLNMLLLGFGSTVMLLTFGIRSSKPPSPPSASSATDHYPPFLQGLLALFKIPIFYIQIIVFGIAFALQWSLFISIEPMLKKLGYNLSHIGYAASLSAIAGFASSIMAGCYVDKSKKFSQVIKGSSIGVAIVACCINGFVRHPQGSTWDYLIMGFLLMMLGFFSIPAFPIGLELGIETTFPIAEASSSGILIIFSQLMLFLINTIMSQSSDWNIIYSISSTEKKDDSGLGNYQLSIDIWTFIAVLFMIFTCFALWPKYKRLEYERSTMLTSKESANET